MGDEQLTFAVVRPPLRLWKNEPLTIYRDARKAALEADVPFRWWDSFRKAADSWLKPPREPDYDGFLAVVRQRFNCTEEPSFKSQP